MLDLKGMQILIVEDEFLLASDLASQFSGAGAKVLGPSTNLEQAWPHVHAADAAILDVNLNGELVFPIADALARRRVPFVFYTGFGGHQVPERFHFARVVQKPSSPAMLAQELFGRPGDGGSVDALLPGLRVAARLRNPDPENADAMVEQALRRAIEHISEKPRGTSLEDWLHDLLDEVDDRAVRYFPEPQDRNR